MNTLKRNWPILVFTALALSIGWSIRGNFGHEYGAMIPGALAALMALILSRREDWHPRYPYFAFFGALGWSFGGSMSYMQVIAYTHSGHSGSVLYGFASLFLIGFLWGAFGGAGTALPIFFSKIRLDALLPPILVVFATWVIQDLVVEFMVPIVSDFRQNSPLYWYDSDWLSALSALIAMGVYSAVRRRLDEGTKLILHMAVGWWIGFLGLVVLLGLRMTPPRGDNWAGCLGMCGGLLVFLWRIGSPGLILATLATGFAGGVGFAGATLIKLLWVATGWTTNWHSVLEQTYGFINGLGIGAMILYFARKAPRIKETIPKTPALWPARLCTGFVLLGITWLNLSKNPEQWIKSKAVPAIMAGLSLHIWFNLAYLLLAGCFILLAVRNARKPIAVIPTTALGQTQGIFLLLLWWMVIGNFERALVAFTPERLVTEGVIFLNAILCTMALTQIETATAPPVKPWFPPIRRCIAWGLLVLLLTTLAEWGLVRAIYGERPAGYASLHIRFGPNATATKAKPAASKPHP